MNPNDGVWIRRNRGSDELTPEQSAYILFTEFCSATMIQPGELAKLLNLAGRKVSVFHLTDKKACELARAMGIDPLLWNQARGADVLGDGVGKHVFLGELRYCPTCLPSAHHSALFQLPYVIKCPVHKELLRTGCPHCGTPIPTDCFSLTRNHMYCGGCGRCLASVHSRMPSTESMDHPRAALFGSLRQAICGNPLAGERRSHLNPYWDKLPGEVISSSALMRQHHLHTVWGDHSMGTDFLNAKTASFQLDVERKPDRVTGEGTFEFSPVYEKTMKAFQDLSVLLERYQSVRETPQGVRSNARVDEHVSAVAAAFWQAACVMGVHKDLNGEEPDLKPWGWGPWFLPWLPEHSEALARVVRSAVHALFAVCLAHTGRLRFGVQVAWHRAPDWYRFLPPWRLLPRPDTGQLELQIRTRSDEHAVERLVTRYREHWLLRIPEGVSPLELVAV